MKSILIFFFFSFLLIACADETPSLETYQLEISYDKVNDRPNILIILVDDLRDDATPYPNDPLSEYFPAIDKLQQEGIRCSNAFVTTSLCSPSRASILSGLYASKHKIIKNDDRYRLSYSIGSILSECGYKTAFIGKWHMGDSTMNPYPQKGWDTFISFYEQGQYINPEFLINGRSQMITGHITNILTDLAIQFISEAHGENNRPFLLFLSHKGVHHPFVPDDENKMYFEELENKFVFPESFNFPVCFSNSPQADLNNLNYFKRRYKNYFQTLKGIDYSLQQILAELEEYKILDNTLIIFMSDNGYFHGEHKLIDKRYAYEESIKIPIIIRYPSWFPNFSLSEEIVLNVDILPTVLQACHIEVKNFNFDGFSINDIYAGKISRDFFLYQYFENPFVDIKPYPEIRAIRTQYYKLITYPKINCPDEFYDLKEDPREINNLINDPEYSEVLYEHYGYLFSEMLKLE